MDALIVVADGRAWCRRLRDIRAGDQRGGGHARHPRGARIEGARPAGVRLHVQRHLVGAAGGDGRAADRGADPADAGAEAEGGRGGRSGGGAHRRRAGPLRRSSAAASCTRCSAATRWACTTSEAALFGTSLGVRLADGRQEEHGHRNHMRAINAIYHAGGVRQAVEARTPAHAASCTNACAHDVPFVLAGSLRDDGPLPDTITDMNAAQDAYAEQLKGAGLVLCLGSMLHSIATGNMLPSWVKIVCVDINPAVATKVSDRGTGQAVGVVTDVGLFLDLLAKACAVDAMT